MSMKKKIRVRAPNGFRVLYYKTYYNKKIVHVECQLLDTKRNPYFTDIGHVELVRISENSFVTHSELNDQYWGKGLGTLLYSKAIAWCLNNGYKVCSTDCASKMAQRVWKSKGLRVHFDIQKIGSHWSNTTWYAYKKGTLARRKRSKGKRK